MDHGCGAVLWQLALDRDQQAYEGRFHKLYQERLVNDARSRR